MANRVIFALSFNAARMEATYFPSAIKNALISFFYVYKENQRTYDANLKLVKRIRQKSSVLFVDSGVFTMKNKMAGLSVSGKLGLKSKTEMDAMIAMMAKKKKYFVTFAKAYARFLRDYDNLFDWAFDLDVDQFLGVETADAFYQYLKKRAKSPRKIVRIWHSTRTFDDWKAWCDSGDYDYLAVEGGGSHSRDFDFYRRFVRYAHKKGIKVHILAATDPKLMTYVPFDTGDSSSWMIGSRYAKVYTPLGLIGFGDEVGAGHWDHLTKEEKKTIMTWAKTHGHEFTPETLKRSWAARELLNIEYFLDMDKNLKLDSKNVYRTSFME